MIRLQIILAICCCVLFGYALLDFNGEKRMNDFTNNLKVTPGITTVEPISWAKGYNDRLMRHKKANDLYKPQDITESTLWGSSVVDDSTVSDSISLAKKKLADSTELSLQRVDRMKKRYANKKLTEEEERNKGYDELIQDMFDSFVDERERLEGEVGSSSSGVSSTMNNVQAGEWVGKSVTTPSISTNKEFVEDLKLGDGSWEELASNFIKDKEKFRSEAYIDWTKDADGKLVNSGIRIGYGSDTITKANGKVIKVKKGMTVTVEDAVRDLIRRIRKDFTPIVKKDIGNKFWDMQSEFQKAALVSIAYNYGGIPGSKRKPRDTLAKGGSNLVEAIQTGDIDVIVGVIKSLGSDNSGINMHRRNQEAQLYTRVVKEDDELGSIQLTKIPLSRPSSFLSRRGDR